MKYPENFPSRVASNLAIMDIQLEEMDFVQFDKTNLKRWERALDKLEIFIKGKDSNGNNQRPVEKV